MQNSHKTVSVTGQVLGSCWLVCSRLGPWILNVYLQIAMKMINSLVYFQEILFFLAYQEFFTIDYKK